MDFNAGAISGSGNLRQAGSGTLVLNAANTFSGATAVNSGTLDLQNQNALQNSTFNGGSGNLVLDASASANAFTFGGLSGSSNLTLVNGASNAVALKVGNNGQSATYSGILSGGGSLIKVGTGTQVIGAANTYGGTTTISAWSVADRQRRQRRRDWPGSAIHRQRDARFLRQQRADRRHEL